MTPTNPTAMTPAATSTGTSTAADTNTPTTTRDDFIDGLVRWIQGRLAPPGVVIGPDTELFAGGLVDSIRILQLIAWTERALGRPIADEHIRMDHFETVRRIAETFLEA